tara:strand:+ start:638 stop:1375 length:738 start_codon:yes stop_codon:yes gene_type:complete
MIGSAQKLMMAASSSGASIPVTSGLTTQLEAWNIGSYPGTGTTWFDISGSGNDAIIVNNPTFSNDHFQLNGSNQYIDLNRFVASGQSELTVIVYVTFSGSTSSAATIIDESRTDAYWQYALLAQGWYTRDTSTGETGSRNNDITGYSPTWFTANAKRMITTRYSVSNAFKKLTFDNATGSSFTSATSIDALTSNGSGLRGTMRIGYPYDGSYFGGKIHAVYVYNRALTDQEVQDVYAYIDDTIGS